MPSLKAPSLANLDDLSGAGMAPDNIGTDGELRFGPRESSWMPSMIA